MKNRIYKVVVLILVGAFSLLLSPNIYASENDLYKRALLNAMQECYQEGEMYTSVTAGGTNGYSSFADSILRKGKKQSNLYIPTSIGTGNKLDIQNDGTKIGCYELFLGDKGGLSGAGTYNGSMTGLLELFGKNAPAANSTSLPDFLKGMGYTTEKAGTSEKQSCLTANYKNTNISGDDYTPIGKVCWSDSDLDGTKDGAELISGATISNESNFIVMSPIYTEYGLGLYFNLPDAGQYCQTASMAYSLGYTTADIEKLAQPCSISWIDHYDSSTQEWSNDFYSIEVKYSSEDAGESFKTYSMTSAEIHSGSYTKAYSTARGYLSGESAKQEFTDDDKYELYSLYLEKVYQIQLSNNPECQSSKPSSVTSDEKYYIYTSNGWCRISIDESKASKNTKVSGFTDNQKYILDTSYDFEGLISAMAKLAISEDNTLITPDLPSDTEDAATSDINSSDDPCWNADLDSMAWILCPTQSNLQKTASALDSTVQDWLEVDTRLYDSDSSTHSVWEIMRNIANTAMIIIMLVVIISQVTGVGIDNYGIKKLLPKLILMAVLINLSFLICQLAVDLSNILGVGLRDLFKSIGSGIRAENGTDLGELAIGSIIAAIFTTVGVAGAAAPVGITIATAAMSGGGAMVVIVILIALLTIIVAVLMFFLALGARLLIIIVCMAIAPLAFVCYILPNTKNLYKQWWKLFESALVIFPICGALSGVSYLLKVIILSTNGVHLWMLIVALLAPYLVFFLLPSLLKKSIAGLGVIGGALTAMGGAFKSGIGKGVDTYKQNSESYKNAAEMGQRNFRFRQAQGVINRYGGRDRSTLNRSQLSRLTAAEKIFDQTRSIEADERAGIPLPDESVYSSRAEARRDSQEFKNYHDQYSNISNNAAMRTALNNAMASGNAASMSAAIAVAEAKGMEKEIFAALRNNSSNVMGNSAVMGQLAQSKNKVLRAYGKNGSGKSYSDFITQSGTGTLQGYIQNKGNGFLDGIDDKALEEIQANGNSNAISNELLMQAAASAKDQTSIAAINKIIAGRSIQQNQISAGQVAQMHSTTISTMLGNSSSRTALLVASEDLTKRENAQLLANMPANTRATINRLRVANGRTAL